MRERERERKCFSSFFSFFVFSLLFFFHTHSSISRFDISQVYLVLTTRQDIAETVRRVRILTRYLACQQRYQQHRVVGFFKVFVVMVPHADTLILFQFHQHKLDQLLLREEMQCGNSIMVEEVGFNIVPKIIAMSRIHIAHIKTVAEARLIAFIITALGT